MDETQPNPTRRGPGRPRKITETDRYCLYAHAVRGESMGDIASAINVCKTVVFRRLRKFDLIDKSIRADANSARVWLADNAPKHADDVPALIEFLAAHAQ